MEERQGTYSVGFAEHTAAGATKQQEQIQSRLDDTRGSSQLREFGSKLVKPVADSTRRISGRDFRADMPNKDEAMRLTRGIFINEQAGFLLIIGGARSPG